MSNYGSSIRRPFDQAINEALKRLNDLDKANGRVHSITVESKVLEPEQKEIEDNAWTKKDIKKNTKYYCRIEYHLLQGEQKYLLYEKVYELNNRVEYENDFMWLPELYTGLIVDCLSAYALVAKTVYDRNNSKEEVEELRDLIIGDNKESNV